MPRTTTTTAARRTADASQRSVAGAGGPLPTDCVKSVVGARKTAQARKYHNTPTEADGLRFDSKREAARYAELKFMLRNGVIRDLEIHPRFPLVVHGQDCGTYVGDFAWIDPETGERVVEDVKSAATRKLPVYRLKRRLIWALYAITVREV